MGSLVDGKFNWVIENFLSLGSRYVYSDEFVIGGCKWRLQVFPRGHGYQHGFSLYLVASGTERLPHGWRRHAGFRFTVANQIREEYPESRVGEQCFNESQQRGGFPCMVKFDLLLKEDLGLMINEKVKIVAEVDVLYIIGEELVDVNGFEVVASKVDAVRVIFEKHPDVASGCLTKEQPMRSLLINALFDIMYSLAEWPDEISEDTLSVVESGLEFLTSFGFKVDWLKAKVEQVMVCKGRFARMREVEQQLIELEKQRNDLAAEMDKERTKILESTTPYFPFNDVLN